MMPVTPETAALCDRILAGDLRALARAATAIENQSLAGREIISELFSKTGHALILGITGPPGAGKSTLVDQMIALMRAEGKTVGVIAVDPSSPFSRGAILGDRIRMQRHHADPGVFIRSMASRGKLGGLARGTLEMALLLDAAGRDYVIVETVGAGQDEVEIARLADITVVVLVPGMGDGVQVGKAGIMEIADVFAINKSDLPGAERLEQDIRAMQSVANDAGSPSAAPIRRVVSTDGTGVADLIKVIQDFRKAEGAQSRNIETWTLRLTELLREQLLQSLPADAIHEHAARVAEKIEDPYTALAALINLVQVAQIIGDRV
jgi:LAO/AO transport system kinase